MSQTKKKTGRPSGAANRRVKQAEGQLTRCTCGSTQRTPYFNRREHAIAGLHPTTGEPFTSIVWRRTSCQDCGQFRDDKHYVYRPAPRKRNK